MVDSLEFAVNQKMSSLNVEIAKLRQRRGILAVDRATKSELSGQSVPGGDVGLLVERQLLTTEFGFGAWRELTDEPLIDEVIKYVEAELQR